MGMYTEVFFRAQLDREAYDAILAAKEGRDDYRYPDHPFFNAERRRQVFYGGSYYFPLANAFTAIADTPSGSRPTYHVSFLANLKNYDNEIDKFFDWVAPHVKDYGERQFVGYSLYEEETTPTLMWSQGPPTIPDNPWKDTP